jgi:hypothetical protein
MRSDREERIRQRAYAIWQAEGHQHGRDEDHWHRAEREIAAEDAEMSKAPRRASRPAKVTDKSVATKPARSRSAGGETRTQKPAAAKIRSTRARKPAKTD